MASIVASPAQSREEAEAQLAAKPVPSSAITLPGFIRLPRSSAKRGSLSWLKLVSHVNPQTVGGFCFEGKILRPGEQIALNQLTAPAVLLECAGSVGSGHRRAGAIYILWKLDGAEWREIARAQSVGPEWAQDLMPIAERLLNQRKPMGVALSSEAVIERTMEVLDRGLAGLNSDERREALALLHDQIVGRVAGGL